ncbi:nucleoid occlusion protein-like [Hydra vulgaris]|uniref:Nucleoid occlusion protein-like n=1 Tax=Hydra vulgaris TaxID=6087 RepID=A0ABM4BMT7_HYDVU
MRIENAKIRTPSNIEVKSEEKSRPSIFTDKYRGEYYNINVDKLVPFHKQARQNFDEDALQQMAETIKSHGVRQPLTIIPKEDNDGTYEIDLHPLELAQAYQQILDEEICANPNEIAKKLGLSRSSVSETMKLLILPENVRDLILKENIINRDLIREVLEESDSSRNAWFIRKCQLPC